MSTDRVPIPIESEDIGNPKAIPHGHAAFRVLERCNAAADEQWREIIQKLMKAALPFFPELAGATITIARLDPDAQEGARANWFSDLVFFPVETTPKMDTVFHELTHLVIWRQHQDGGDVPHTSEPYCSLLSTSRIRADWIQRDDIAYLGEPDTSKTRWPDVCQRALDYRAENGAGSHYIKRAKEWLEIPPQKEADRTL